jgi:acyl-CoA synthetase (NDP forming)
MYLEDVKSGRRFVDVARKNCQEAVIILKSGRTEAGKKAVSSHTASLAGNDMIYDAAFKQVVLSGRKIMITCLDLQGHFPSSPFPLATALW